MAAITATAQPTASPQPRVDVSLSAWSADGPVQVYRVHADGTRHEIYMPDTSGGLSQVYDYGAPFSPAPPAPQSAFTYEAMNGATLISSASVTLSVVDSWLSSPGLPSYAVRVALTEKPAERRRERPMSRAWPSGRTTALTRAGVLRAAASSVTMRTKTDADAVALEAVVESAPRLLLRIPGIRQSWQHIDCDGFGEAPPVPFMRRTTTGADNGEVGEWAEWSLGFTVAGDPVALPFGDPTASYQAIVDKGWTYQQLLDWKSAGATTYVQVLRGGF